LSAALAVALTWVCCLPILAGLLGVGVASFGAWLEPWRPYLLVAGAAAVGLGLITCRRVACSGEGCSVAAPHRRIFLWVCAAAIGVAAALPYLIGLWVTMTLF
jgi:hypothetical protein